jgi:thioredoxin 1
MAGSNTQTFTDANFNTEVLQSPHPVLVDFWAEWCGPCKYLTPTVDALADEFVGKFKVGKLDIDTNQSTAVKFGIMQIPTILVFHKGQQVKKLIGLKNKAELVEVLNSVLDAPAPA